MLTTFSPSSSSLFALYESWMLERLCFFLLSGDFNIASCRERLDITKFAPDGATEDKTEVDIDERTRDVEEGGETHDVLEVVQGAGWCLGRTLRRLLATTSNSATKSTSFTS